MIKKLIFFLLIFSAIPVNAEIFTITDNIINNIDYDYKIIVNENVKELIYDSMFVYFNTENFVYIKNKTTGENLFKIMISNSSQLNQDSNFLYLKSDNKLYKINKFNGNIDSNKKYYYYLDRIYTLYNLQPGNLSMNNYSINSVNTISISNGITLQNISYPITPKAYWEFDDNLTDLTGNGNNGTFIGTPSYNTTSISGKSLFMNGSQGVNVSLITPFQASGSYNAWFYSSDWGDNQYRYMLDSTIDGNNRILLRKNNNNKIFFYMVKSGGDAEVFIESPTALTGTGWKMITATWTTNNAILYINSSSVGTDNSFTMPSFISTIANLGINWVNTNGWNGNTDSTRIYYNYVLSPSEINELFIENHINNITTNWCIKVSSSGSLYTISGSC